MLLKNNKRYIFQMKHSLLILLTFGLLATGADGQSILDGPYVRYEGNKIIVSIITDSGQVFKSESRIYPKDNKTGISIEVVPALQEELTFHVKLRGVITRDSVSYNIVTKTLFLSDVEGEFTNFRKILLAAGVIDEKYQWTFGQGCLVVAGDLFDRGKDVVPELWLLYKLEDEAKATGGSVRVILGNHDIMNLSGDHRYTDPKYFQSAKLLGTDCASLFDEKTELGQWLRSKNVAERIGDILVTHGGISPAVNELELSLDQLNDSCRRYYGRNLADIPESSQPLFDDNAPFWYRGYFMTPRLSSRGIDSTLNLFSCRQILVGHTILKKNIAMYYEGKVIAVDVDEHTGVPSAALFEGGNWWIVDQAGKKLPLSYKAENDIITNDDFL